MPTFDINALIGRLVDAQTPRKTLPAFDEGKVNKIIEKALIALDKAVGRASTADFTDLHPVDATKMAQQLTKTIDEAMRLVSFTGGDPDIKLEVTEKLMAGVVSQLTDGDLERFVTAEDA